MPYGTSCSGRTSFMHADMGTTNATMLFKCCRHLAASTQRARFVTQRCLASQSDAVLATQLSCQLTKEASSAQAETRSASPAGISQPTSSTPQQQPVAIHFTTDDVFTTAVPGDNLWSVAAKCGVSIPTSCGTGSCGTCEMEVRKFEESGEEGGVSIARTCIAAVPPGYARLQVESLDDGIWGLDGFDT